MGEAGDRLAIEREFVSIDDHHTSTPRACDDAKVSVHDPGTNEDVDLDCSMEETGAVSHPTLHAAVGAEPPTRLTVEKGKWFLVSDDRHVHLDSRDFGQVGGETCQHIVFRLVGPGGYRDASRRLSVIW
jgi:signal peptidase I